MKKLFLIYIMLATSLVLAVAQQAYMTPEEQAKSKVNKLTPLLSLTAEQKTKIIAIEINHIEQIGEKIRKVLGDMNAQQAIIKEHNKLRDEEYKSVLTADQFKKYQEYTTPAPLRKQ